MDPSVHISNHDRCLSEYYAIQHIDSSSVQHDANERNLSDYGSDLSNDFTFNGFVKPLDLPFREWY